MLRLKLREDWRWITNHAWSFRLMVLALILSAAEAIMPLFTSYSHPVLYAVAVALISAAALAARVIAQKHIYTDKDEPTDERV